MDALRRPAAHRPWRRKQARGRWYRVVVVIATALVLVAAVGLVAHFRAPGRAWSLGISAFSPYLMLAAPVGAVVFAISRGWIGTGVAIAVTVVAVTTQLPLYTSTDPPAHARTVVVMTSNLKIGGADPVSLLDAIRRHGVEVLMLQELTPAEQQRLVAAGLDRVLPFHVSDPRPLALGTGLWSRYPLSDEVRRTDFSWAFVTASAHVPGVGVPLALAALHLAGPYPDPTLWHRDIAHLPSVLPGLGGGSRTVLAGGDFNATPDLHQFRKLLTHGYADAAEQAGAGMTRTFPADTWLPPLIAIDHVLTRRAVATGAETVSIEGTDHRALLVRVAVPTSR